MSFKVAIKNIGKLADAELRIGRFTVFAGPNNTGKSFVSKLLYSLYHAMREDYAERGGSVILNSLWAVDKWISARVMPPPRLALAG